MADQSPTEAAAAVMRRINRAWRDGRPADIVSLLHPDFVMVFPGFADRVAGREAAAASFADFCERAALHEFHERDLQADVVGETAVVSFAYELIYDREGARYRATGRDLWVFAQHEGAWQAVWRTMLESAETPA